MSSEQHALREIREILAAHGRPRPLYRGDAGTLGVCTKRRGQPVVVDDRRIAVQHFERRVGAVRRRDALHDAPRVRFERCAQRGILRAKRAAHLHAVGDDVVAIAALDRPHRHHDRLERVGLPRRDVLQREHGGGGRRDRVDREVGRSTVAATAFDRNIKLVGRRVHDAGRDAERAGVQPRVDMEHRHGVDARVVERAGLDHRHGAAGAFFRRLEQQHYRAGEAGALGLQRPRRAEQHRGVGVVPARVHHPFHQGGARLAGALLDGQGVHVGAQAGHLARVAPRDRADHAGAGHPAVGYAERVELPLDAGGGPHLFEAGLGVQLDLAAEADRVLRHLALCRRRHQATGSV